MKIHKPTDLVVRASISPNLVDPVSFLYDLNNFFNHPIQKNFLGFSREYWEGLRALGERMYSEYPIYPIIQIKHLEKPDFEHLARLFFLLVYGEPIMSHDGKFYNIINLMAKINEAYAPKNQEKEHPTHTNLKNIIFDSSHLIDELKTFLLGKLNVFCFLGMTYQEWESEIFQMCPTELWSQYKALVNKEEDRVEAPRFLAMDILPEIRFDLKEKIKTMFKKSPDLFENYTVVLEDKKFLKFVNGNNKY